MEKAQWGESSANIHRVQEDEPKGPLHPLLSPLGHEGWDPQHTAAEAFQPLQESLPPLFIDKIPESSLHHGRVHGNQVGLIAHIPWVVLHWGQVAPSNKQKQVDFWFWPEASSPSNHQVEVYYLEEQYSSLGESMPGNTNAYLESLDFSLIHPPPVYFPKLIRTFALKMFLAGMNHIHHLSITTLLFIVMAKNL